MKESAFYSKRNEKQLESFHENNVFRLSIKKICVASMWRQDRRRAQVGVGVPGMSAVESRRDDSSLNQRDGLLAERKEMTAHRNREQRNSAELCDSSAKRGSWKEEECQRRLVLGF